MTSLRLSLLGMLALTGCGLISSDVTNFDLTLKPKSFTLDTSSWQITQQQADTFLSTPCQAGSMQNVCTSAAAQACAMGCTGRCGASNTCELDLDVGVYKMVDLGMEQPELNTLNNEPLIKVTIDSLQYEVTSNTLNVATPPMTLYVAPMSIMDPKDPMAKAVGTVDPVPAMTTVALRDITYATDGKQALVDIMGNYKNPFNVIVGATLTLKQGDMVPSGKLDAQVDIKAHAAP
jgi:hypothetical protein